MAAKSVEAYHYKDLEGGNTVLVEPYVSLSSMNSVSKSPISRHLPPIYLDILCILSA